MIAKKQVKIRVPVPQTATVYAEKSDKTINLLLYEVEELEELDVVRIENKDIKFHVKNGQYVKKGDTLFSGGFLGHKIYKSDSAGIVELNSEYFRILGQKHHVEKRVHLNGFIKRIVPRKCVDIVAEFWVHTPAFLINKKKSLTRQVYFNAKKDLDSIKNDELSTTDTVFINDTITSSELAKLIALGAKRIIANAIFIESYEDFRREIQKLEGFCILTGFGELIERRYFPIHTKSSIFWGKRHVYFGDAMTGSEQIIYEHPFWGISGKVKTKHDLHGELEYNAEHIDFYLKNLEIIHE